MLPKYYLQYHNADALQVYPNSGFDFNSPIEDLILDNSAKFKSWIFTRKKLVDKAVGQFCFLIVGKTEKIKKYYLWAFFKIEKCESTEGGFYNVLGTGSNFEKPILLNELNDFNSFKNFCGNFGIGFQNIDNHIFCKTLVSLCSDFELKNHLSEIEEGSGFIPTAEKYEQVISKMLTNKQIEILQTLYYFPDSSATAKELAKALNYESYHAANRQIGQIGKIISEDTGFLPPSYKGKKGQQPAYFLLIGEYYKDTGWNMWEELREALENLGLVSLESDESIEGLPTESSGGNEIKFFKEGKVVHVFTNRYERNQKARKECIKNHGNKCKVCDFDFGTTYGEIANGFIHIHHKKQLSEINEEYNVDPINDLIPLCANCHSVIHLKNPAMTIDELKELIKKNRE